MTIVFVFEFFSYQPLKITADSFGNVLFVDWIDGVNVGAKTKANEC